jgi:lipoprotein signal peptidase
MSSKSNSINQIDRRILYASMAIVVVLAVLMRLKMDEIYSLLAVLLIIFVALGNIGYFYTKSKTRKGTGH